MKLSLTYHITLFILKLKGLKKDFSKDPIDYKKIRKEDVHHPKANLFRKYEVRNFNILNSLITEIKPKKESNKLVLFVHGGAFISGPTKIHWDSIKAIAKQTSQTVWMCDYPKAPENKITEISNNIDAVYKSALEAFSANNITLIGDSVGATLITALTQRLIQKSMELPNKIILVSPVMDATMTNPEIDPIDKTDPILGKAGVLSAKKMCTENNDLSNPMISPINGSFVGFPNTILFLATNDIMYPDQKLTVEKLTKSNAEIEVILGENMPHIWPFLPVMKEAKLALYEIINTIN